MKQWIDILVNAFVTIIKVPAALIVFGLGPLLVVGWFLHRRKKRYKEQALEPFIRLPLRPPGESLRLKIDGLSEAYDDAVLDLAITSVTAVLIIVLTERTQQVLVGTSMGLIVLVTYVRRVPRIFQLARDLWDYRLGYTGERVVGEELNQLLARGFRVFHDVPFESFNIDHVLVGAPGVFVVETKTRRKPAHIKGQDKATITFDGATLHFPGASDAAPLQQTLRNAKTLSELLSSALAEPVPVKGILTYPGWWIDRKARGDVNVLNPDEIKHSFATPRTPLAEKQVQQIANWLTEKCRMRNEC